MKIKIIKIGAGVTLLILIALAGFILWAQTPSGPMPEALAALQSTAEVEVVTSEWLIFKPANKAPENGLIIYPGGRVDPRSYAPSAAAIAQQGYLVVITPMPLNLAVFSPARALEVQHTFPEIKNWSIAGHSLGGAMAANLIRNNPQAFDGLILWASYPAENDNLSEFDIRT
ncbi:MAG TPA: alpha/beta hydrolase, partial [Anaerolineales bacterium]|nr:alpha/beta hydrolase [Anaerolineales bacterium]